MSPVPCSGSREAARNFVAAFSLVGLVTVFYALNGWLSEQMPRFEMLIAVALFSLALLPYYRTLPADRVTKSRLFWRATGKRFQRLDGAERNAVAATGIKLFFLPLMLAWTIGQCYWLVGHLGNEAWDWPLIYHLILGLILLLDLFIFTVGYAVEHPRLGNEIRSVDTTPAGLWSALICYPPLALLAAPVFAVNTLEPPAWTAGYLDYVLGLAALMLMAVYVAASVALGFRASNLTHRGVVRRWPYSMIRHPAYAAKVTAWWVCSLPVLAELGQVSVLSLVWGVSTMLTVTVIYALRALTEERHLGHDPEYRAYCRDVRRRFVPGVF